MTTLLFLLASGANAAAQLLLKRSSLVVQGILNEKDSLVFKLIKTLLNPLVAVAVILLATGMFIWLKILSKLELSRAYPINIALTIFITSVISIIFFQESFTWIKALGIVLVMTGIWAILAG